MLVAFVMALLVALLVAFALWMSASQRSSGRPFDIVITQSVSGLVVGSPVTFLGVPVGRVTSVQLDPTRPSAIRVRIDVTKDDLPITGRTVARLSADLLFGTTLISLEHATGPLPPRLARAGDDAVLIPVANGGMGDLINDPEPMIESIAYATDRLMTLTSPEQLKAIDARLEAMERSSAELAAQAPMLNARIAGTRQALRDSAAAGASSARQADLIRQNLDRRGPTASRELRSSLAAARDGIAALNQRMEAARPQAQSLAESAAGTSARIREARQSVAALKEQVQQVERRGIGGLISSPPTPDYAPRNGR